MEYTGIEKIYGKIFSIKVSQTFDETVSLPSGKYNSIKIIFPSCERYNNPELRVVVFLDVIKIIKTNLKC